MWNEIEMVKNEGKHELILSGPEIAEKVSNNNGDVDDNLFSLGQKLYYLKLENIKLTSISSKISNLEHLTQLVICGNSITFIPKELSDLTNLAFLDLSLNKITKIPDIFRKMNKLRTIIMRNNFIESVDTMHGLCLLQEFSLDNNKLKSLPDDFDTLDQLMVLSLSSNCFDNVPSQILDLKNLKTLNMENNSINDVPTALCRLVKLKQVQFKNNPLKNERTQLRKLISDNLYKAILENLKKNDKPNTGKSKKRMSENNDSKGDADLEEKPSIRVLAEQSDQKVIMVNRAALKRNQTVYFILKNLNLEGENLKKFIKFQEDLHKSYCDNRKHATIGFHDLGLINFPLTYSPKLASEFTIQMMNSKTDKSGQELYENLVQDAERERKVKKRSCPSGVYQYLYMIEITDPQGVVEDKFEKIISFPPLTNCDSTKVTAESSSVLVEVIGVTLAHSKEVCSKIVKWLLDNGVSVAMELQVQPVRVFEHDQDDGAKMLVVFPDKTDLTNLGVTVTRD